MKRFFHKFHFFLTMDNDIQEVFDCFERTLDAELTEINTIDAAIGGVEVRPRSSDAARFEVNDSRPFGNPFDPNQIPVNKVEEESRFQAQKINDIRENRRREVDRDLPTIPHVPMAYYRFRDSVRH